MTWRAMDTEDSDLNARIRFRRTRDRLVVAAFGLIVDGRSTTLSRHTNLPSKPYETTKADFRRTRILNAPCWASNSVSPLALIVAR